ncbi:MAG: hypothetical protein NTZ87_03000, partial [Candidatus Nomurabacteria bacterium]|nr:hypothetical protein [Candidatus Nomurabacteria bacterium]
MFSIVLLFGRQAQAFNINSIFLQANTVASTVGESVSSYWNNYSNFLNKQVNNLSSDLANSFTSYYNDYTSGLATVLYPVKTVAPVKNSPLEEYPLGGGGVSTPASATPQDGNLPPRPLITKSTPQEGNTKIVYIQGPAGPQGPVGPQGPQGPAGASTSLASPSFQPAYVGIIQPNPAQNFSGATLFSATDLSSNHFTTNTAHITDVTVSGSSVLSGSLSVAGATTLAGTLNVTGTITGNVTGSMNPNLTLGSVLLQGASGITEDNANFFYDATNHALGLGTITPASTSILDLTSTTKGFLPPRMTTTQKNAIVSPATGLTIFDTTLNKLNVFNGTVWKNVGSAEIGGEVTGSTAGSVLFVDSSGLAQDNSNLFYDSTNHRLGLGTTTPTKTLDVAGAIGVSGQLTSTLATGTAPFVVASTTNVANLNASSLNGATFANPGAIGTTPSTGAFTTLTSNGASTLGTGASLTNTFGTGTSAINTIGASGGTNAINGATTILGTTLINSTGTSATTIGNSTRALTLTGTTFGLTSGSGLNVSTAGALSGITTLGLSGQLTSTLATGTAPFVVASTTNVANLNASSLNGATFANPG